MPELESVRTKAEAIGRITCIKTDEEIGLLYQWDNGETQAALYEDNLRETPAHSNHSIEPSIGPKTSDVRSDFDSGRRPEHGTLRRE